MIPPTGYFDSFGRAVGAGGAVPSHLLSFGFAILGPFKLCGDSMGRILVAP